MNSSPQPAPHAALLAVPGVSRERGNSESRVDLPPLEPRAKKAVSALAVSSQGPPPDHHLSASSPAAVLRSISLPRHTRAVSAEPERPPASPEMSLPPCSRQHVSPRVMRRTKTIDTHDIAKEEFEDHIRVNQYKVLDIIGHGSYGIVRKATIDDDEVYAMKIVGKRRLKRKGGLFRPRPGKAPPKSPLDNITREIAILKKLHHPNVVQLYEVLDDPQEDDLILVFEYIPNGPVISQLPMEKPFTEEKSRDYFIDLLLGIEYLHSQHVIHRDIKPENLLLDSDYRLKIADFGVSEDVKQTEGQLTRWAGTPAFQAPEVLEASQKASPAQAVDVWAAGITLYCFLYGRVPWSPPSVTELYEQIKTEPVPLSDEVGVSEEARDLLTCMLSKDPVERITIARIREHPWLLLDGRVLPSKGENCQETITVSEDDLKKAFKPFVTPIRILVMIKKMAKNKSLSNPYSPKSSPASSPATSPRMSGHRSTQSKRSTFAHTQHQPIDQSVPSD